MIWTDGGTYRCLRDTNFSPEDAPAGWEMVRGPEAGSENGEGAEDQGEIGAAGSKESGVFNGDVSKLDTE